MLFVPVVKLMLENGYLILSSKPHMVFHRRTPLCFNCKVINKCIHTKYMCLNQWTMVGMVRTCTLQTRCVRSTHTRDTLSKFFDRQA